MLAISIAVLTTVSGAGPAAASGSPPVAQTDSYLTHVDIELIVPAPGVLANDSDPEGDPLTAQILHRPHHGVAHLHPDGSFRFVPAAGFAEPTRSATAPTTGRATRTSPGSTSASTRRRSRRATRTARSRRGR